MKVGDLVFLEGELLIYKGHLRKTNGRVLRFEEVPSDKERLICEHWWLQHKGEAIEEDA